MGVITSGYFFWCLGIVIGQIYYLADAPFFRTKRIYAFLYGIVNLVIMCIGAKLLYIAENFEYVLANGVGFQGFSLFGAIMIHPLSCCLLSKIFKTKYEQVASFIIIPFLLMLGFYRFDCLISGCCGGISVNGFQIPTQIIESVFCFVLAVGYIYLTHRKKLLQGQCFNAFFVIYGIFRFLIEFARERTNIFLCFSPAHIWALLSIVIGVLLIFKRKIHRENN